MVSVMGHCEVRIRITSTGNLEVLSEIPQATFTLGGAANPLLLTAQATLSPAREISWSSATARRDRSAPASNIATPSPAGTRSACGWCAMAISLSFEPMWSSHEPIPIV